MTTSTATPAVLDNRYPVYDPAGNRCQFVKLRFICGHIEQFYSLDLGRMGGYKWKPRTNRQLTDEHLRITCPIAWKLCRACSESPHVTTAFGQRESSSERRITP